METPTREYMMYIYKDLFINHGKVLYHSNYYYLYDRPSPTGKRHYIHTSNTNNVEYIKSNVESKIRSNKELEWIISRQYYVSRHDYDGAKRMAKEYELNKIINNL